MRFRQGGANSRAEAGSHRARVTSPDEDLLQRSCFVACICRKTHVRELCREFDTVGAFAHLGARVWRAVVAWTIRSWLASGLPWLFAGAEHAFYAVTAGRVS